MIEAMRRNFSEHQEMQAAIAENPLETMKKMSEIGQNDCRDYPEIPDRYMAQPLNGLLFSFFTQLRSPNHVSEPPRETSFALR